MNTDIFKYEQKQRLFDKMRNMTSALTDFTGRVSYDEDAEVVVLNLYKDVLSYLCDAVITIDDMRETQTKNNKKKVK